MDGIAPLLVWGYLFCGYPGGSALNSSQCYSFWLLCQPICQKTLFRELKGDVEPQSASVCILLCPPPLSQATALFFFPFLLNKQKRDQIYSLDLIWKCIVIVSFCYCQYVSVPFIELSSAPPASSHFNLPAHTLTCRLSSLSFTFLKVVSFPLCRPWWCEQGFPLWGRWGKEEGGGASRVCWSLTAPSSLESTQTQKSLILTYIQVEMWLALLI